MAEKLKTLIIEDSKPIQVIYNAGLSDSVFEKRFEEDGTKPWKSTPHGSPISSYWTS